MDVTERDLREIILEHVSWNGLIQDRISFRLYSNGVDLSYLVTQFMEVFAYLIKLCSILT